MPHRVVEELSKVDRIAPRFLTPVTDDFHDRGICEGGLSSRAFHACQGGVQSEPQVEAIRKVCEDGSSLSRL